MYRNPNLQVLRHDKHWAYVRDHTVVHWSRNFTEYMVKSTTGHNHMKTYMLGLGLDNFRIIALDPSFRKLDIECLLPMYNKAKKKLILCDYDGTLVPTDQVRNLLRTRLRK